MGGSGEGQVRGDSYLEFDFGESQPGNTFSFALVGYVYDGSQSPIIAELPWSRNSFQEYHNVTNSK